MNFWQVCTFSQSIIVCIGDLPRQKKKLLKIGNLRRFGQFGCKEHRLVASKAVTHRHVLPSELSILLQPGQKLLQKKYKKGPRIRTFHPIQKLSIRTFHQNFLLYKPRNKQLTSSSLQPLFFPRGVLIILSVWPFVSHVSCWMDYWICFIDYFHRRVYILVLLADGLALLCITICKKKLKSKEGYSAYIYWYQNE